VAGDVAEEEVHPALVSDSSVERRSGKIAIRWPSSTHRVGWVAGRCRQAAVAVSPSSATVPPVRKWTNQW